MVTYIMLLRTRLMPLLTKDLWKAKYVTYQEHLKMNKQDLFQKLPIIMFGGRNTIVNPLSRKFLQLSETYRKKQRTE